MASTDPLDLVVIGTGGAAMAAGIEARRRGRRVQLVEHGPLGGTCLNVGCVPSKTLLAAVGQRHRAATNPFAGIVTLAGAVDLPAVMEQKHALIERMRQAKYADVAAAHGFAIQYGHASFASPELLLVDDEPVPASAYLVATGAQPHVPTLPGLDGVEFLTSTTAMDGPNGPAGSVSPRRLPALPVGQLRTLPAGHAIVLARRTPPVQAVLTPWWAGRHAVRIRAALDGPVDSAAEGGDAA